MPGKQDLIKPLDPGKLFVLQKYEILEKAIAREKYFKSSTSGRFIKKVIQIQVPRPTKRRQLGERGFLVRL